MTEFVEVQQLLGKRVRDEAGRVAGRIESIRAEKIGPRCLVHEYLLGTGAFLTRLGIHTSFLFGFNPVPRLLRVPWRQLDLTDPSHPRIRCSVGELQALQSSLPPFEDEGPPKRELAKE